MESSRQRRCFSACEVKKKDPKNGAEGKDAAENASVAETEAGAASLEGAWKTRRVKALIRDEYDGFSEDVNTSDDNDDDDDRRHDDVEDDNDEGEKSVKKDGAGKMSAGKTGGGAGVVGKGGKSTTSPKLGGTTISPGAKYRGWGRWF